MTELIIHAADGIFKLTNNGIEYFIRHNHQEVFIDKEGNQRGVPFEVSKQVRYILINRINDILKARTFDDIYQIVNECKVNLFRWTFYLWHFNENSFTSQHWTR